MTTYELILDQIASIPAGSIGDDRTITWLTASQVVGMARNSRGNLELFLIGDRLTSKTGTVRSAMQYHSWHRENQVPLDANRMVLPALGYFDQVGAFIASELLREGADTDLKRAFAVTEPLIELSIKRLEISGSAILGLVGELLVLEALCRRAGDVQVGAIVQSWDGWRRSTRDFTWEGTGVEVKTTTRRTSSHAVQGVHQIEPVHATDEDAGEDRLLFVSVGLSPAESAEPAVSIPSLVDSILERLNSAGAEALIVDFLSHVSVYGSEAGIGYDHATMSDDAPFAAPFIVTFVRTYNMGDPAVEVLRRDDVVVHQHVDVQSLTFRVDLPAVINTSNPMAGMGRLADAVLLAPPA